MVFVLLGLSALIFYLTRGLLPPSTALAAYINPRLSDAGKLSIARAVGIATASCPSFTAFADEMKGCVTPLWIQYFTWMKYVLTGNWGYSLLPGISGTARTWNVFFGRFPFTAELDIVAAVLTFVIGLPLGIISATHSNKAPDHISRIVSIGGYSIPQFWFGAMLQIIFVLYARIGNQGFYPASGVLGTA